jgi:hypothetical protein
VGLLHLPNEVFHLLLRQFLAHAGQAGGEVGYREHLDVLVVEVLVKGVEQRVVFILTKKTR